MSSTHAILTKSSNRILTGVSMAVLAVAWSAPALARGLTAADVAGVDRQGPVVEEQPAAQGEQTVPVLISAET